MRLLLLAALALAAPKRDAVLFLGDSLTAGYGVSVEEAFPALLERRWRAESIPYKARNAGVSGSTSAGVLETADWTLAQDVHTVFLCIGANDGLRGLDLAKTEANISALIALAKKKGSRVVLAGMKIPPNYGPDYSRRFAAMFPRLARRHKVKLMPFLLEGVAGRPEMNIEDGIHPSAQGHEAIAARVHAFLLTEGLLK